uniref:Family with sequence similarity 47 member E n=1 Tax=Microcebus murinus TaxID=30608 RepID=A0A8C5Y970_MICMU
LPPSPKRWGPGSLQPPSPTLNLPSKCFPKDKNSRRWVFVGNGPDNFRDGCLPGLGLITRGPEQGFLPRIHHRASQPAPERRQNQLPKDAPLFSRLSPARRARLAFLEEVEARLASHPWAVPLHLEEAMPAELLLKVLEVLDPDRKLEDAWGYCQDPRKRTKEYPELFRKNSMQVHLGLPKKIPVPCSGQWLYEEKPCKMDLLHKDGLLLYENGSSNIDEEFILRQFDVDCPGTPSRDVLPTLRPNPVPRELQPRVGLNTQQELDSFQKLDYQRKLQKPQNPYKPKKVKMRYGAWYLDTKLWKKQRADEPLVDPKVSHKAQHENFKKRLQEQEEFLADLCGAVAFKDFILSRGYRMPSFLEKMYPRKECQRACNKTPIKLTQA